MSRAAPATILSLADRFALWVSTGRITNGLWIGSSQSDSEPDLQRVEAALHLIEQYAPLHYQRVKNNLSRIWVTLVPHGAGCYRHSMNACLLDERVMASENASIEWIATAIVHEATHARLEKWGIRYDEAARHRIERICARRELDFARHLSGVDALHEEITWRLDRHNEKDTSYTDQNMWQKIDQGHAEILRHLGMPEWIIALVFRARTLLNGIRRFTRRSASVSIR
ncbi:hypothetical protein [Bradyrhizobium sp. SZCCHNR1051]|uniref:hypothetical protein n=1 Tax=Bradyrhizobium sp. SZCCHNR1051 TaxID=3057355 RepID=UPI0029162763|nr:hypothetical protein [Bradyrhizobium sp. SZCCHNR1051]